MSFLRLKPFAVAAAAVLVLASPFVSVPALAGTPGSTAAINVDEHGIALAGYDAVAYFDTGKPTHGKEAIVASYGGARYLFASEAHRKTFLGNPQKYIPEFGGFCAVGTSFGEKVDIDPETGKVVNGKLYVNNSPKVAEKFDADQQGTIMRAEQNWPTVKDMPQWSPEPAKN
jgi:YHS domain-containing protein